MSENNENKTGENQNVSPTDGDHTQINISGAGPVTNSEDQPPMSVVCFKLMSTGWD